MSYVLQIWSFPVPQAVAEVDGILSELNRRPPRPNTQFVALAQRLTARHPCITTLDEDDDNAVWTDGPLDGRSEQPVWGLGVLSQHLDTVLPFVVETATSMGFVVHDDQAGECHLPGGWSLLPDGRRVVGHHLGMPVPEVLEPQAVRRLLLQAVEPVLALNQFRFEAATGRILRERGEWSQTVELQVQPPEPAAAGSAGSAGTMAALWRVDAEVRWGHAGLARMWNELDRAAVLAGAGPAQRYRGSVRTTFSRMAWWTPREWPKVLAVHRADTNWVLRNPDELRQVAVCLREVAGTALPGMVEVLRSVDQLSMWCLSEQREAWKRFWMLQATPSGLEKVAVQRWMLDTEGCGGAAALLMLAGVAGYPALPRLLERLTPRARHEGEAAARRLELAAQALRDGGFMPPAA